MLAPATAPARALAASRRRPSARASWRSASQSRGLAGTGRLRVGLRDGGNREQRPPDIAVAARPRQPGRRRRGTRRASGTARPSPRGGGRRGRVAAGSTSSSAAGSRSGAPCRRCAGQRRLPARAGPRATPRCPACAACAACSAGSGCSLPRRDPTGPTRPCSRARPPSRQGLRDPPIRVGPRSPRRGPRRCPRADQRRPQLGESPEASRTAAVLSPSCASEVRAASRYVLPTIGRGSPPPRRRRTSPTRRRRPRESRGGGCPEARGARRRSSAPPAGAAA